MKRPAAEVGSLAGRNDERFEVILASIADSVIATDQDGRVAFMNATAERLTGWPQAEALGLPLEVPFQIINETTRRPLENPVARVLRHGKAVGLANHSLLVARDGTEVPIEERSSPMRRPDGVITGVALVFRDVTERRRADIAARRLAAIVENSDDAIVSKDLTGKIISWNLAAQRIFGYTPEEIIGQSIMTIIPFHLQDQEREILQQLRQGLMIDHFETQRLTKDGREIAVSLTISPIKDHEGRIVGASKIARDITERKRAEAALAVAQRDLQERAATLEQTVADRTLALRQTVSELEAFSYSLSHDMRAPLRAIQSYTQVVLEDCKDQLSPKCATYLHKAVASAERLDRLILDLLAFTRLSREEVALQPLDIEKLLRDIIHERPEFQLPNAEISVEGPFPPVLGHEASLTQCVTNLLDNAVKYVARGVRPHIRISSEANAEGVRVCFEDNGIGIDPAGQRRLFQMFQRVQGDEYEGTGIGLAIVRKAVERMHGQVGVASEPGQGSRFWLQLPGAGR
jgi:PAS domain S-box-containing protein